MVILSSQIASVKEKEIIYLTTHSTHFIYGYMASYIWFRTTQMAREKTRCCHMGYSFRLAARVLLYAPFHWQDNTYHGLCYTSRPTTHCTIIECSYYRVTSRSWVMQSWYHVGAWVKILTVAGRQIHRPNNLRCAVLPVFCFVVVRTGKCFTLRDFPWRITLRNIPNNKYPLSYETKSLQELFSSKKINIKCKLVFGYN